MIDDCFSYSFTANLIIELWSFFI